MSKISAAKWLFHHPVGWLVPDHATYSEFYTQEEGMSLTGDDSTDVAIISADKFVQQTPAVIAQLLTTGIKLSVNDPKDAVVVYEKIMEHLNDWLVYLSRPSMQQRDIPIEGLREFNNLAKVIFNPANRHHYHPTDQQTNTASSALERLMTGNINIGRHSFNDKVMIAIEQRVRDRNRGIAAGLGGGNEGRF